MPCVTLPVAILDRAPNRVAWPNAPVDPADAPGQAELFADDYAQPDAAASEPVLWAEPTRPDDQRHPSADAPASA
ncbi:MAG: hypothetical protein RL077_2224 [Verrucomicrobiota bacterium]